jgi:Zn-dependent protease with chaperone function
MAWVALLVLGAALVTTVVATTPWHPLPGAGSWHGDAARDFTPAQIERAKRFHSLIRWPFGAALLIGLVTVGLLGLTGGGSALIRWGGGKLPWWWLKAAVGTALILLILVVVGLPLNVWSETILRRYGLSTQSWGSWTFDVLKSYTVAVVLTSIGLGLLIGLARAFGDWWFVPGAAAAFLLVMLASFAYPVVVAPLFNQFTPMPDGPLRTSLLRLAADDGVPVDQVLVADASRRTTALNAYVSGFGSTKRIVVYDTLLDSSSPEQVRLVVAHELGHAKNHDVLRGTLIGALGAAAGVAVLALLLGWPALLERSGVTGAADPAVVALLVALTSFAAFLALPVQNLVSRHIEARADVHSLNLTHDPGGVVHLERRLAITNLSQLEPNRWLYAWFGSHPTTVDRIEGAREWARLNGVPVPPPSVSP